MSNAIKITTVYAAETTSMETLTLMRAELTPETMASVCAALGLEQTQVESERFETRGASLKNNLFETLSEEQLNTINQKRVEPALYRNMLEAKAKLIALGKKAHVIAIVATKD